MKLNGMASSNNWNGSSLAAARNRVAPSSQNVHRAHSRLSLLPTISAGGSSVGKTSESLTPTHVPVSANTRSGAAAAAHARKRRQTSGAELGRP